MKVRANLVLVEKLRRELVGSRAHTVVYFLGEPHGRPLSLPEFVELFGDAVELREFFWR